MMSQEEFKQYLDIVVERAFKAGVVWKQNGSELMTMNEAIRQAQRKILECKTDTFNWNNSKFVEKKCENTIDEISLDEAKIFYDMENEKDFPVLKSL